MQVSEQLITQVAQEILETLAFLSTRPVEEVAGLDGDHIKVGVEYSGPFGGMLIVNIPYLVLPELTANMLGVDLGEEGGEQQQRDALGELANVICGNLLGQAGGTEEVFNLQAPGELQDEAIADWQSRGKVFSSKIGLSEGWAEIILVVL